MTSAIEAAAPATFKPEKPVAHSGLTPAIAVCTVGQATTCTTGATASWTSRKSASSTMHGKLPTRAELRAFKTSCAPRAACLRSRTDAHNANRRLGAVLHPAGEDLPRGGWRISGKLAKEYLWLDVSAEALALRVIEAVQSTFEDRVAECLSASEYRGIS